MPFGAELRPGGRVRFRLWAPAQDRVHLRLQGIEDAFAMARSADGWHELETDRARAGSRYVFELGGGLRVPDPASRFQPDDVHGPSEVVDPAAFAWSDAAWRGRPWEETVLYELHVGSFTREGSFRGVIGKLDHLSALGVTAIELMPVADFPGRRNWGYDGVLPFAPDSSYGRPEDLKALVDAAHRRGLMVFLDVVYNHFGPDGNHLHAYAPQFFTERHHTPWGAAINFDGHGSRFVRDFFIHNALYWLEEYRLDGLRLDAVHAIMDDGPKHILEELAERVHERWRNERLVHLVLENAANQARFLARDAAGRPRWYAAQWDDDLHHCLHALASGERAGYYADYADSVRMLGRALAEGFVYQGKPSPYHHGEPRGEPSAHLPGTAFVGFIQNHDQIGNRAFGERLTELAGKRAVRAMAAIYLLCPSPPMLFMGEEWAAPQPFPFFCDFRPELAPAVRDGRRNEFARFPQFRDPALRERIPDPGQPGTFAAAHLDWRDPSRPPHAGWLDWYRRVLAVRHREVAPRLPGMTGNSADYRTIGDKGLIVTWRLGDGGILTLWANPGPEPLAGFPAAPGRVLLAEEPEAAEAAGRGRLPAWSVVWFMRERD